MEMIISAFNGDVFPFVVAQIAVTSDFGDYIGKVLKVILFIGVLLGSVAFMVGSAQWMNGNSSGAKDMFVGAAMLAGGTLFMFAIYRLAGLTESIPPF